MGPTMPDRAQRMRYLRAIYLMGDYARNPSDDTTERGRLLRRACGEDVIDTILARIQSGEYPAVNSEEWPHWKRRAVEALRAGYEPPKRRIIRCPGRTCPGCTLCAPAPERPELSGPWPVDGDGAYGGRQHTKEAQ